MVYGWQVSCLGSRHFFKGCCFILRLALTFDSPGKKKKNLRALLGPDPIALLLRLRDELGLLNAPLDLAFLEASGSIVRDSENWFRVPNLWKLPESAAHRIRERARAISAAQWTEKGDTVSVKSSSGRGWLRVAVTGIDRCRRCGAIIVWARTENGKKIPLNPWPLGADETRSHFKACFRRRKQWG
jgi:hypothetical protein